MDRSELFQALILWYVVRIALDMTQISGTMGIVSEIVGLAIFFSLPVYIAKNIIEVAVGQSNNRVEK